MDYELAMAMGWDAGNASMIADGRTVWNEADQQVAWDEMERVYPTERRMEDRAARAESPGWHCFYCHVNVTLGEDHTYDCRVRDQDIVVPEFP